MSHFLRIFRNKFTKINIDFLNYRKALNDQKEMKLLLDMYKGVSKDQRDKVQLMATEKKLRSEIEELRNQMKKIQVQNRKKNIAQN